ncbi:hypothetical protein [Emticicia sp. SJ17W-69]|uniref:hypothetical protein n=1 Tax=Emticicia sp. SJ17W-69 TaxID=3421657 RepID=UPI003EB83D6D
MSGKKSLKSRIESTLSSSDINYIKHNATSHTLGQLVGRLGRSENTIKKYLKLLDLEPSTVATVSMDIRP